MPDIPPMRPMFDPIEGLPMPMPVRPIPLAMFPPGDMPRPMPAEFCPRLRDIAEPILEPPSRPPLPSAERLPRLVAAFEAPLRLDVSWEPDRELTPL